MISGVNHIEYAKELAQDVVLNTNLTKIEVLFDAEIIKMDVFADNIP